MSYKSLLNIPQNWVALTKTVSEPHRYWMPLPGNRLHEVVDFVMDYFVKQEIMHIASGIPKSNDAMEEYKHIVLNHLKSPSVVSALCCADKTNDIIAISSNRLRRKDDNDPHIQAQTPEVKKMFEIEKALTELMPIQKLLSNFSEDSCFDDEGYTVHPNYRYHGLTIEVGDIRKYFCKENKVSLTGAWMTAIATQKISKRDGWETVFEIPYEEMEKKLNVKFHNPPPTFQYNVTKIDESTLTFPYLQFHKK